MISKVAAIGVSVAMLAGLPAACSSQPQKPRDFVEIRTFNRIEPTLLVDYAPDESLLFGPHFGLSPHWTATWESLSADDAERLGFADSPDGFRAADGYEFVAMRLGSTEFEKGRWPEDPDRPKLTASLSIDGRTKKLGKFPGAGTLIFASAPKSAPVKLTINDGGHEFSLDLRTAKPDHNGYQIASQRLNEYYEESGVVRTRFGGASVEVNITVDEVSREPYVPGLGWAKKDRTWLRLSLTNASSTAAVSFTPIGFFLDAEKTFALQVDGQKIRPRKRLINTAQPITTTPYVLIFDVPKSFRRAELTVTPDGPMFTYSGEASLSDYYDISEPPQCGGRVVCLKWQQPPKPQVVGITLS
ncbi:MAG TPA: hypothetical protein VIL34_16445 [Actinopolymorphaceae bacterium]|jgi:hypothetical protein